MLYQILQYIKHLLNSKNQHGVHSPFVYNLVTKCFYQKTHHQLGLITGVNSKSAKLLYRVLNYCKPEHILEIGHFSSINSVAMSIENPKTNITYLNNSTKVVEFLKTHFEKIGVVNPNFNDNIKKFKPSEFDIVLFNLNNEIEPYLHCFEALLPATHNNTIFIFNAIHSSKKMSKIWNSIKQHPKITVSIDTYFLGFAFIRKEQAKEHFTIRV